MTETGDHFESGRQEQQQGGQLEVVDWLFRTAAHGGKRVLGGWRPSVCMLGATCLGYAGFGGIFFNLVLYLIRVRGEAPADAANDVTNLLGTMFFTSAVGGLVGDAYLGRIWTVLVFLLIYLIGAVLAAAAATISAAPSRAFFYGALYVAAVGNGSYEPGLASLGGDQFRTSTVKTTFFNWFFVFSNIGQLLALSLLAYLENRGSWSLGFWISAAFVFASLPAFFFALPFSRQFRPSGNPLLRVLQVLFCALKKHHLQYSSSSSSSLLHEVHHLGTASAIPGSRKLPLSPQFRWLDKAAISSSTELHHKNNPWSTCTVTQVEEVKCLIRIFPFFLAGVCFNTIIAQITTLFIVQGSTMNGHLGPHFDIPPGSMQAFTVISSIAFAPFYDSVLVPILRKKTGHEKGLTTLQRMGWGMLISIVAMVIAAFVEKKRLNAARSSDLIDTPFAIMPISIYWLVPQYVIIGISLVFTIVGQMDFFYTEVSDGMRSLGISLPLVCRGLGNYASTLLVTIVTRVTTSGGKLGWIPSNINRGHIDYFYWLLAVLMAVTLIFYLVSAHFYTYLHVADEDDTKKQLQTTGSETL